MALAEHCRSRRDDSAIGVLKDGLRERPSFRPYRLLQAELEDRSGSTQERSLKPNLLRVTSSRKLADTLFYSALATLDAGEARRRLDDALNCDSTHVPSWEYETDLLKALGDWQGGLECVARVVPART
jgi:hypothetical protein